MPHKGKAGALRARIADVGSVGVAGIIIAITGFVIIAGLAKVLDPTLNAEFMVFWSVLFWAFGAMNGIQFETVRAVKAGRVADAGQLDGGRGGRRARAETVNGRGAPVLTVVSVWTAGVGVLLAATSPLWGRAVFQDQPTLSGIVVAVGVAGFTLYSGLVGVANGNGHWRAGAVLSSLEALFRLIAIAAVTLVVWHLGGRLLLPIKAAASVGA
ncbi:MAG: hypothetical protein LBM66_07290, partial [Bifidobacteriaceae bacterium]|nr:hypothetical protein [Bifidobacteriaceae bacterium]